MNITKFIAADLADLKAVRVQLEEQIHLSVAEIEKVAGTNTFVSSKLEDIYNEHIHDAKIIDVIVSLKESSNPSANDEVYLDIIQNLELEIDIYKELVLELNELISIPAAPEPNFNRDSTAVMLPSSIENIIQNLCRQLDPNNDSLKPLGQLCDSIINQRLDNSAFDYEDEMVSICDSIGIGVMNSEDPSELSYLSAEEKYHLTKLTQALALYGSIVQINLIEKNDSLGVLTNKIILEIYHLSDGALYDEMLLEKSLEAYGHYNEKLKPKYSFVTIKPAPQLSNNVYYI